MEVITGDAYSEERSGFLSPEAVPLMPSRDSAHAFHADLLRNPFQKDRDKILHSKSFRRLSHKTQVFLAVEGDHFRTRLTHTLEVAQIARTIARGLGLNEDLTEAIALGHDLGHTPFGHAGEEALRHCIAGTLRIDPASDQVNDLYRHNEQSVRVVEVIENGGKGLSLTPETRNGILCHTGEKPAKTLEGRIVATADRIAYVNHDIDDAIRAGFLSENMLPDSTKSVLGTNHAQRIETLVENMVITSAQTGDIGLSEPVSAAMTELRAFLFRCVYQSDAVNREVDKARRLMKCLYGYYLQHPQDIPAEYRAISQGNDIRAVVDYLSGMTDRYAISCFEELFTPRSLG